VTANQEVKLHLLAGLMAKTKNLGKVFQSPFRYPGGKGFLSEYLENELLKIDVDIPDYAEPYAGGAGAAIKLLSAGKVRRIRINDADQRIYSAWSAILNSNERFIHTIDEVRLDIENWNKYAEIVKNPALAQDSFQLGFATFFLNRTNRSGIILKAGPIGGHKQAGDWKLDARFNKDNLIKRIKWIGEKSNQITLSNLDGLAYLKRAGKAAYSRKTLFFVDPPYVKAGGRLYLNLMTERKHQQLGEYLEGDNIPHWVVTYDHCPLIEDIYSKSHQSDLTVVYSLQKKRNQRELLIKSPSLVA
jgi:DNA adenine methylase